MLYYNEKKEFKLRTGIVMLKNRGTIKKFKEDECEHSDIRKICSFKLS